MVEEKKTAGQVPDEQRAREQGEHRAHGRSEHERLEAATFKLLFEGRDGKLALFEDADGHFTAVRTSRLA